MANRLYEFRGKRISNGEWIFGDLIQDRETGECFICEPANCDEMLEVNPETVGQFTGKFDMNGNKIFEGDIVEDTLLQKAYKIRWDDFASSYGYAVEKQNFITALWQKSSGIIKVIGNIYDSKIKL